MGGFDLMIIRNILSRISPLFAFSGTKHLKSMLENRQLIIYQKEKRKIVSYEGPNLMLMLFLTHKKINLFLI